MKRIIAVESNRAYYLTEGRNTGKPGVKEYLLEDGARVHYNASEGICRAQNGQKCRAVEIGGEVAGFSFKRRMSNVDRILFELTDEGRVYLEYNRKIGGDPFGYTVGMPVTADPERYGGIAKMYQECIKREITWEELLQWSGHSDELPLCEP